MLVEINIPATNYLRFFWEWLHAHDFALGVLGVFFAFLCIPQIQYFFDWINTHRLKIFSPRHLATKLVSKMFTGSVEVIMGLDIRCLLYTSRCV